ncbi:MAG: hypothetical protein HOH74_05390, partial [Gemmatimonadetes bacterium]|nr:hypothetical protein [Gemmatimonadota bacterium]
MLVSFIALLFLCLYAIDVGAHGGPWAVAAPVSGITADGDLTDWPTNVSRQAISHHIWGERAGERDLSATLSVAYGLSDSMLFVSVEAIDDSEVTDSSAGTQGTDGATLYVAIGHDKVIQAELLGDARLDGPVRGRSLHRQGVHTYEWSVPLANHSDVLSGRSIIGLDVAIGDRDADGTFSRVSWGQVRPHWPLAGEIGDVWIATGDDAAIAGCVEWEDPEEGATLGRVRLRRIDSPSYETQVSTGADGCFRLTNLAAGEYEVSAGFWYEATARIGDWATWTAIDSVDLLPGRSADLPRTSVPRPRGGRVVRHVFESPSLAESLIGERSARVLTVYVPEAYDSSSDSFALIYWFPGFNGIGLPFRSRSWLDQAIKEGHLQSAIIVGFDLETAYGGSFLLNSRVFGRWENFVVDEVVPYLDASYRTIPSPKGRIAMGTSVGGWSALMLSVLHPGVWGSVGADDPSVWLMWDYVSDSDDFPQQSSWQDVPSSIKLLPESLTGLSSA